MDKNDKNDKKIQNKGEQIPLHCSRAIHPGEILQNEIEFRGVSGNDLANQIGLSSTVVNEILVGKRAINTRCAMLLEAALGIDSNLWMNLQNEYNKDMARQSGSFMKRIQRIREVAAFL